MKPTRIWIDCDPGLDDAAAILMALGSPRQLSVEGISTVAGNSDLGQVTANALGLVALCGRADVPVHAGCPRAILADPLRAEDIHGAGGIGGVALPEPMHSASDLHAVDAIDAFCRRGMEGARGTLVVTGPMTNVALSIVRAPQIVDGLERIVFMGGVVLGPGNVTAAAEFNFACDPHAARVVLECGVPCVMMGLDVTRQVEVTDARISDLKEINTAPAETLARMMEAYRPPSGRALLHDPCTIAYLLVPALFDGRLAAVTVDCNNGTDIGRSVADWNASSRGATTMVITKVDADGFFRLLIESVSAI